jgi:hypothetical protein
MAEVIETEEHAPVLTVTEARGASRGKHVAWVLGVSTALAVAALGGLYVSQAHRLTTPGGQTSVEDRKTSQGFNAPDSQPRQSENPKTTPTITPGVGTDGKGV